MSSQDARTPVWFLALFAAGFAQQGAAAQLARPRALTDTIGAPTLLPPLDLDGDGDIDILVAAGERSTLHRFENLGGGHFARVAVIGDVPAQRALWAFSDVDGDGDIDVIAVTAQSAQVFVLLNQGNGTLAIAQRVTALAGSAIDVHIADVEGDGLDDIVVTTDAGFAAGRGVFEVRRTGSNRFSPATRITPQAGNAAATITGPTELADLDGDGDLDVIITNTTAQTIQWFRNTGSGPSVAAFTIQDRFRAVDDVAAGDVDGDGDIDIVVAIEPLEPGMLREVRWYRNNGGGVFTHVTLIDASATATTSLNIQDLDGDGDLDVITARADGAAPNWFENDGTGPQSGPLVLPVRAGWDVAQTAVADLDGDGVADLLYACTSNQVGWSKAASAGAPTFRIPMELTARTDGARDCATTDFDGDGDIDVLVAEGATGTVALIENRRAAGFSTPVGVLTGLDGLNVIEVGDLDGDGDDDLAIASFDLGWLAWSENRAGSFASASMLLAFPPSTRGTLQVADLDGDGDLDVIVSSDSVPGVTWFEQRTGGLDTTPRLALTGPAAIYDFVAADLEGDGLPDLLVTAPGSGNSVGWFRGLGGGSFAPRHAITTTSGRPGAVVVLDADGDGDLDVATAGIGFIFPILEWIPQLAPGQFGSSEYAGSATLGWPELLAADVDLDGDVDLIGTPTADPDLVTEVAVYRSPFAPLPTPTVWPRGLSSITAADIDGDGDVDLLVTSEAGDSVDVLLGTSRWQVGVVGCTSVPNSTGTNAKLGAVGTNLAMDNTVRLQGYDLPQGSFTVFLTSRLAGSVNAPGGSVGTLCLGGAIGRFVDAGQIQSTPSTGVVELDLDLAQMPQPGGSVLVSAGETWHFQAWYRDLVSGQSTSNFSDSVAVELR